MGVSRKNYYKNSFGTWLLLSEQSLFASNFPGAASYVEGSSALDFPLIHDARYQDQL